MAALSKVTKIMGLADVKIAKMTEDLSGDPTYDAVIDIPAIQDLSMTPNYTTATLEGDDGIVESDETLDDIDVTFSCGKLNLDALAVIEGASAPSQSGTTPNQTTTYTLLGTDKPGYFKLEGQVTGVNIEAGADMHLTLFKVKGHLAITAKTKTHADIKFTGKAIRCESNMKIREIVLNETKTAIA